MGVVDPDRRSSFALSPPSITVGDCRLLTGSSEGDFMMGCF